MKTTIPGYVTVPELAEVMSVSQGVIRWHIRVGNLPAYSTPRDWIIPESDADNFAQGRQGRAAEVIL